MAEKIVVDIIARDLLTDTVKKVTHSLTTLKDDVQKTVTTVTDFTNKNQILRKETTKITKGYRRFRMEMLSVMFFGKALSRTFGGLIQTSMDWAGVNDILKDTLGVFFLPVALEVQEAMLALQDIFLDMDEPTQKLVGWFVLGAKALGDTFDWIGQLKLGWDGLKAAFPGLTSGLKDIWDALKKFVGKVFKTTIEWLRTGWELVTDSWDYVKDYIKDKKYKGTIEWIKDKIHWDDLVSSYNKLSGWAKAGIKILVSIGLAVAAIEMAHMIGKFLGEIVAKSLGEEARRQIREMPIIGDLLRVLGGFGMAAVTGVEIITGRWDVEEWKKRAEALGLQEGGIVTRPTIAMVGERGPEAVVPLGRGGGYGSTIYANPSYHISASISNDIDIRSLAERLNNYFFTDLRRLTGGF